ncbi:BLUF domain-containing protein [Shewanella sp. NIFS-20-20]|uniref:BLUF domain-containing protein n=1 Tax=Shewanella sp. NIFS-20-20 TaxID=2853806 RepID=UPI001C461409|nr:BLUF domain-containing protein [Shewanella sp. NIFS-20-20]MBV7317226.1 BLUF domain-containing protein [Shewanella sp. NIFS-20-20]
MGLIQLIYASRHHQLAVGTIRAIVEQANMVNNTRNISGFLCADHHYFLQCLEGEASTVDQLFTAIRADERHSSVTLISRHPIAKRQFHHWGMGAVLQLQTHQHLLETVCGHNEFNPYQLTNAQCLTLLDEFMHLKKLL